MKKNLLILTTVNLLLASALLAQTRFIDPVFSEVRVTEGITYGTNISILPIILGESEDPLPEDLLMDIYEPVGDTLTDRPVVILAHRGDFLPAIVNQSPYGTRKDSAIVEFCNQLAKRGYIAVSMDYRLGWNPFGSDIEIKKTVLEASYRIGQDMRTAVRFLRKSAAEDGNPYQVDPGRIAVGGFDAAGFASNNVAYLKNYDQVLLPKFLDFGTVPPTPFIIPEVHGDPYGIDQAFLNIPNHPTYSSDVSCVIDVEGGLGDISWIEAGDPPTISFQSISKFDNFGIRDVTIGVGGSIIIAEGAFPDTIVYTAENLGNQDVFLNNLEIDSLTENARALTGVEGLYLYTPYTQEGSVQCDMTAGVPAVGYGGNTYAWNWYDEATFAFIWDMIPNQTVPSEIFICQYNTSEGNPNDPSLSRLMIDTMVRYMTPRLVAAMQLIPTTSLQELNAQDVDLKIFPRPTNDFVQIKAGREIKEIILRDVNGKILENRKINGNETTLSLQKYAAGFYMLNISFEHGVVQEKVLVTK